MLIPGASGRWRWGVLQLGHEAEPPLQTTSGQGCRQREVCIFKKRRTLIMMPLRGYLRI